MNNFFLNLSKSNSSGASTCSPLIMYLKYESSEKNTRFKPLFSLSFTNLADGSGFLKYLKNARKFSCLNTALIQLRK